MNIFDTRELAERLEELQNEREALDEAAQNAKEEWDNAKEDQERNPELWTMEQIEEFEEAYNSADKALEDWDWDSDNKEELDELENLESEISEWAYGATLIDESDFVEYCQELLEDIGDIPRDMPGYIVIDWDATADNLKADYITVTYQGTDYLVRA